MCWILRVSMHEDLYATSATVGLLCQYYSIDVLIDIKRFSRSGHAKDRIRTRLRELYLSSSRNDFSPTWERG